MAKKPDTRRENRREAPEFKGFINYNLSDDEKKRLKEVGVDHERLWDTFESLAESAYYVKIKYDYYNHAYQAVMSTADPKSADAGWYVVGRGSTPMKAFRQAIYIGDTISWNLADFAAVNQSSPDQMDD
jgi:hypothetical protein